jgi:hypothetical protein
MMDHIDPEVTMQGLQKKRAVSRKCWWASIRRVVYSQKLSGNELKCVQFAVAKLKTEFHGFSRKRRDIL